MNRESFNALCAALPASTHVVQWGGADVWKVGGKVFAIAGWDQAAPAYTFKVTPLAFEILRERPGLRPAPYLASRGMSWIQHFAAPGFSDAELREYIATSHRIVARGLTKANRRELGLN